MGKTLDARVCESLAQREHVIEQLTITLARSRELLAESVVLSARIDAQLANWRKQ